MNLHGTCVALDGAGVFLRGPSGAGKSDLALRLIDQGALLVADDQILLRIEKGRLVAAVPSALAGRIEIRGLGIRHVSYRPEVALDLIVDLVTRDAVPRLPEPRSDVLFGGIALPVLALHAFDASTPAKLRFAAGEVAHHAQ